MNRIWIVCLTVLALVVGIGLYLVVQPPKGIAASPQTAPALQRGIGVQMAQTNNAQPMPEADEAFAWVITVTANGGVYFRTDSVSPTGLMEKMISTPRDRQAKLYIKADTGAPFSVVRSVMAEGQKVNFSGAVLLTAQLGPATPGTVVPPKGIEVQAVPEADSAAVVVQLFKSPRIALRVKLNKQEIRREVLDGTLVQVLGQRSDKAVVVKADGQLRFGQVVDIIDQCRAAGATVVLETAGS